MKKIACLLWPWLLALLAWQPAHAANPVEELHASGHLQIAGSLEPAGGIVPGQKVRLTLEIATDRWFTGGTRISIPEVPGLVILQTEQFASNSSENRAGQTWVVQRWTLDIYPQRAGEFTLPPIPLLLKVNAGESGDVQGQLHTAPIGFSASVPKNLSQADQWVAAPRFQVRQHFDRSLEGLEVGDAFEREIVFEASDVMAMMLPAYTPLQQEGLAVYPSPPVLDNSNNRGQTGATRSLRISYVVQAEGQYQLPASDYYWWNTASAELQLVSLPATDITVGAGSAVPGDQAAASPVRQLLALVFGLALLVALLMLARKLLRTAPMANVRAALAARWSALKALRKPALPRRLNPGSSAGD